VASHETGEQVEALWYVGPGRAEIRTEPINAPGPGEVRVRALHSAISRGTERLVAAGAIPESEFTIMRAPFMGGQFPFPVKYGYAIVGRVEDGPPDLVDRPVFSLHPHQSAFVVPQDAVHPLPEAVPPRRAVLAANMETALNAVWDAAPGPADRIAIVGGGVVGALVARLCAALPGAQVTLVDILAERAALAHRLGVQFASPDGAPRDCDVVFHASGTAQGLATALALAGDEASVLELSWFAGHPVAAPLGAAFHSRRLRLISSQVGRVSPSHRSRWAPGRRLEAALRLLVDPACDALIEPAIAWHELPARLPNVLGPVGGVLCQVVDYPIDPLRRVPSDDGLPAYALPPPGGAVGAP
jgi:threonine dehydrogenase-like Zn-dependent dehydrogenase